MKTCLKCGVRKKDSEFSFRSDNSGKLRTGCKRCACVSAQQRYLRGPEAPDSRVKHGQHNTKLYKVWGGMKGRCANPKSKYHGEKGISVCAEWRDFLPFQEWAVSNGYIEGLYIDRILNSGDYCPSNCRWATSQISGANRGTTKLKVEAVLEIRRRCANGELQKDLAKEFGVARNTVSNIVNLKRWRI